MKRGDLGATESIKNDILSGAALLWLVCDTKPIGAVVTQISQVESGKVCTIVACGGECILNHLPLLEDIETYATNEDCRAMRIMGRKGWMRALPDYRALRVVLEKEL